MYQCDSCQLLTCTGCYRRISEEKDNVNKKKPEGLAKEEFAEIYGARPKSSNNNSLYKRPTGQTDEKAATGNYTKEKMPRESEVKKNGEGSANERSLYNRPTGQTA